MYQIRMTTSFSKDVERCKKRNYDMTLLNKAIHLLAESGTLPANFRPHRLSGNYAGSWEAHLKADWLLIWQLNDDTLILTFTGTGTHSDLF